MRVYVRIVCPSVGGDRKCGSRKCDTVKIARAENAGVEKARVASSVEMQE